MPVQVAAGVDQLAQCTCGKGLVARRVAGIEPEAGRARMRARDQRGAIGVVWICACFGAMALGAGKRWVCCGMGGTVHDGGSPLGLR
ncbi:hypothetical protein D9M68_617900 [compost metagenome]